MSNILQSIVDYKKEFVAAAKSRVSLEDIKAQAKDALQAASFGEAIKRASADEPVRVIAEVKKASPSKGIIREDFHPVDIAQNYTEHGASAISVLTDEHYFKGSLDYLTAIHGAVPRTPLLRKDFTIDEYQIYEAKAAGASAVLLITGILDKHELVGFRELANELGMDALTEVHLEKEGDIAAENGATIIGVNNRDLRTFHVDLSQTLKIINLLGGPRKGITFVAESGIATRSDVVEVENYGVDAILVGESLMRLDLPGTGIPALIGL